MNAKKELKEKKDIWNELYSNLKRIGLIIALFGLSFSFFSIIILKLFGIDLILAPLIIIGVGLIIVTIVEVINIFIYPRI